MEGVPPSWVGVLQQAAEPCHWPTPYPSCNKQRGARVLAGG